MNEFDIKPCKGIAGTLTVPGDKSISHRLAMLCGLAEGTSEISNFLMSEDCLNTLGAMEKLGAVVQRSEGKICITGTGGTVSQPDDDLDLGNSGTGMRLLAGLLAGQPIVSRMIGDSSLMSRPMKRIQVPLEKMGVEVILHGEGGCAPVEIKGGTVKPIEYELPMASAQVKSCVLLAGLGAEGKTTVVEPRATRDHTEKLLSAMGANIDVNENTITLEGGANLTGGDWTVPGDFSSAAFWMAAAAAMDGAEVTLEGVGLNPRRTALMDVLIRMGADISVRPTDVINSGQTWEEVGAITVRGGKLKGTEVGGDEIPNLIDELPLVAVVGALAEGETVIRDAAELRVKESDRISTVVRGLEAFSVKVEEHDDGMTVYGADSIKGGIEIDSHGDHRIAMSMAVLGLFADAPVVIKNVACVDTSYPGFYDHMKEIVAW